MRTCLYALLLIVLCFFVSCRSKDELGSNSSFEQIISFSDSINIITLANNNNQPIVFQFKINDIFPLEMTDIVEEIEQRAKNNQKPIEEEAWKYVTENTFFSKPYSSENWQHEPLLFLNSIGGGFCDDRATVLAVLWKAQGFNSRIIGIEGHVIPEVYTDDKWQMYDPDYAVYYCNDQGEVKSVRELELSKDYLVSSCNHVDINPVFKNINPISIALSKLYHSTENNNDVTEWHLDFAKLSEEIILPANSSLELVYNSETGITNLRVNLNSKSFGNLQLPFVPISGSGQFSIKTIDTFFQVFDTFFLFPQNKFIHKMEVDNIETASVINYLINPRLSFMKCKNTIVVQTTDSLFLTTSVTTIKPEVLFGKESLFYEEKKEKYQDFLHLISNYNNEEINEHFLLTKFNHFLDQDNALTPKEKSHLIKQFKIDLQEMDLSLKYKTIIKDKYPISVFYLMVSSKYQKMSYLQSFMK